MRVFLASAIVAFQPWRVGLQRLGLVNTHESDARASASSDASASTYSDADSHANANPDAAAYADAAERNRDDQRHRRQRRAVLLTESGDAAGRSDGRVAQHRQHHPSRRPE